MCSVLRSGMILPDLYHYVELADGSNFVNHSDQPTCELVYPKPEKCLEMILVAARPIKKGEEISESYADY